MTVVLIALIALLATTARESTAQLPLRVAVTFDDVPMTRIRSLPDLQAMAARLLDALERHTIVTVGFVNEIKLDEVPAEAAARQALLAAWLDRGHELGNHTYSHLRLYDTTVAAWGDDVLRGERVTRGLMAERGRVLRYFRHPTLNTGRDLAAKAEADRFLADHGYTVAPVTVDNDEYLYALAYDRAGARGDSGAMRRLDGSSRGRARFVGGRSSGHSAAYCRQGDGRVTLRPLREFLRFADEVIQRPGLMAPSPGGGHAPWRPASA